MQISKEVLRFLTCPVTNTRLVYDEEDNVVVSCAAGLAFPVVNGIPILLTEQGVAVSPERLQQLQKISADETRKAKQSHKEEEMV